MTVNFKFDVGDYVIFMHDNKLRTQRVREVRFGKYSQMMSIEKCIYYYLENMSTIPFRQEDIFETKEECLSNIKTYIK